MRKKEPENLGKLLETYIEKLKISSKLKEAGIVNNWEEIVGKAVAGNTYKLFIYNNTLYVYLYSSIVRNELHMIKDQLVDKVNAKAGKRVINEIILR